LRKLDHAFSSLLRGEDSDTGEVLPGFEGDMRRGMSKTDIVRCKSLVEGTRVMIVDIMSREPGPELEEDVRECGVETDIEEDTGTGDQEREFDMDIARVYEQTIMQLGERLDRNGGFGVVS
jgi:hypothetical protein